MRSRDEAERTHLHGTTKRAKPVYIAVISTARTREEACSPHGSNVEKQQQGEAKNRLEEVDVAGWDFFFLRKDARHQKPLVQLKLHFRSEANLEDGLETANRGVPSQTSLPETVPCRQQYLSTVSLAYKRPPSSSSTTENVYPRGGNLPKVTRVTNRSTNTRWELGRVVFDVFCLSLGTAYIQFL